MQEFKPEEHLQEDVELDFIKSLPASYINEKTVLGIDIYKYSQYPETEQIYIPVIFEWLYHVATTNVLDNEKYFFSKYAKNEKAFKAKFISTGDGGFQIFDDVIQALIFATYFQIALKRFVTSGGISSMEKNLHKIVDSIELRYAISRDKIYSYRSNFFGPAIINNARILSKDNLNRLLLDKNSVKWLDNTINSPENLLDINKSTLMKTNHFRSYQENEKSKLFDTTGQIFSVDIQKIGAITAKNTTLDIFNMRIQAKLELKVDHQDYKVYVVTLGNLNTSGLNT